MRYDGLRHALISANQKHLVENLQHAHAHTRDELCALAHEAHTEITRLQHVIDVEQRIPRLTHLARFIRGR
ncbi:MAG: hypothetical protein EOP83_00270 [Verrucomicrobiaceae bacterium]|nr:MAG: hypothetical protein EOP83_00270 [Verrucomicrobiaceae bacterium]